MTVADPTLIVSINTDVIVMIGSPEDFYLKTTNPEHKNLVIHHMEHVTYVPLIPGEPSWVFGSGKGSYLRIVAAMVAVNPSVAVIREAPEIVWRELEEVFD